MFAKILYHAALFIFLSGCQVGPAYQPPKTYAPEKWKHSQENAAPPEEVCNWWRSLMIQSLMNWKSMLYKIIMTFMRPWKKCSKPGPCRDLSIGALSAADA